MQPKQRSFTKTFKAQRKTYTTRQHGHSDVFDYIEMFYSPKRRNGFNNQLSPVEFEKRHANSYVGHQCCSESVT